VGGRSDGGGVDFSSRPRREAERSHRLARPTGQTVDILLEVTNPGLWMAHCHIAEHHESGMMFSFTVDP
jgi:FtsP/CotA-like multicopper oxidase with cupredoxin domain